MRLSKKIALIFGMTSVLTTVIYVISSGFMTSYLFSGEISRIESISSDYINQYNNERARITARSKEYLELIQNSEFTDIIVDAPNLMNSIEAQDRSDFDCKIITDKNLNDAALLSRNDVKQEIQSEYSKVISEVKAIIRGNNNLPINGVISGNTTPYVVFSNPINKDGQVVGHFIVIEEINDEKLREIMASVGKNIRVVSNIDEGQLVQDYKRTNSLNLSIKEKENEISSYYNLEKVAGLKEYYLEISEPALVTSKLKTNTTIFSVLILCINLVFNFILLLIIEKLVVRRIEVVNKEINRIRQSKRLEQRLPQDKGNDEISILTRDINTMFESLQDYNNRILSNEKKYSRLVDGLDNGYALFKLIRDKNENIKDAFVVEANTSLVNMLRVSGEKVIASSFSNLIESSIKDENLVSEILKSVGGSTHTTMKKNVQLGVDSWAYLNVYPIEEDFFALILTDVSENKKYAEDMKHLANYDILTNLQNRYSLNNYLQSLKKRGQIFSIYFIDLDDFKTINDTLGHNVGDEVLCRTAQILQSVKVPNLTVGRLGGDEFLVIMEGNNNRFKVKEVGETMLKALNTTFKTNEGSYKIKASIGAALFPDDTDDIESLLKYGDIAMYKSKKSGGNRVEVFSKSMFEEVVIETKIREAINKGELVAYFQPILSLESNKIVGAEALVRWDNEGEIIEPSKFVPIAKKTGDIVEIDNYILREACAFCKEKRDEGYEDFKVSINASYKFLKQPDFMPRLDRILEEFNLSPEGLEFEITEDELLDDIRNIVTILERMKRIGVKIALDDFGVGYSAFSYIKMLPIDTIKIDRALLLRVEQDRKTLAIISALIQLAHTLNFDVVAEGIEFEEQMNLLRKLKCDEIQGFYVSKPVPKEDFPTRRQFDF